MKAIRKILWVSIFLLLVPFLTFSQTIENSYVLNQQVAIGGSSLFYVQISGAPSGAIITNVEVKFEYIAYGVVQNYVSCRFNKGSDPGTSSGILLVSQGSLLSGNPGTWGYNSYSNWNNQSGINTNYYFRFNLAASSPYTCTINKIYVKVTYAQPTLTVTAPNGGETWYKGTNYTITWNSLNVTGNIQIDLYKGGTNVLQLAAGASNTGSYTFNPPTSLTDGSDYKIGISAMSGSVSDFSNNYFSIISQPTPTLTVTAPNGGETWYKGTNYTITWNSSNVTGNIQIDLYKGGTNVLQLAAGASNTGSYTFNPPTSLTDGSDYRIGISAMSGTVSNIGNYFTISSVGASTISILVPVGGETWYKENDYTIRWNSSNISGNVQIDLYKSGTIIQQLAASEQNDGEFLYYLPASITNGSDYQIRISAIGVAISDISNYFIIESSCNNNPINDYPYGSYQGTDCSTNWLISDPWSFYQYQCVSWVAYKINNDLNISFSNTVFGYYAVPENCAPINPNERLSNACRWNDIFQLNGILVNSTPSRGAVAHWEAFENGAGMVGHVGFVECVIGDTVVISNYNGWDGSVASPCNYGIMTIVNNLPYSASNRKPGRYIHTEAGGFGGITGLLDNYTQVRTVNCYPNPTNSLLNINFGDRSNLSPKKIVVLNVYGSIISTLNAFESTLTIDLTNYSTGLYLIIIEIEGKIETHKIMKQ